MGDRRRSKAPPPDSSKQAAASEEELSFEAALERLEAVVERLESGDLELEGALEAFESGVALARRCAGQLDAAEQRIEILIREGQKWIVRPFEESDEADT
jgi:exodeoxyribonuclease VII small subunit